MRRFYKLLPIVALGPILAACSPSDEELCTHFWDLIVKDTPAAAKQPSEADLQAFLVICVEDAERDREKFGVLEFNKAARCIMAAETMTAAAPCYPPR